MLFDPDIIAPYVRTRKPPYITKALITANVLVFIAMCIMSSGAACFKPETQLLIDWGANWTPLTLNGQAWRLFTACFIHIGILHIAMNMAVLWYAGPACEALFGQARFLFIYIISGLGGFLCSTIFNPDTVCAGASGAIIGLFGAYFAFLCTYRKELGTEVFTQSRSVLVTYLVYCGIYGFTVNADFAGHVGGLIVGFIFAYVLTPSDKPIKNFGSIAFSIILVGTLVILFLVEQSGKLGIKSIPDGQALLLEHKQDWKEAIAQYQQQIINNKADKKTFLGIAYCNWQLDNVPEAIKYQTLAINNGANLEEDYLLRSQMYTANEQWDKAMADVNHVLSSDPSNIKGLLYKAKVLYRRGKDEEAIKEINKILVNNADDKSTLWLAAQLHLGLNHPDRCIIYCKTLLQADPNYTPAYALLAKAYAIAGDFYSANAQLKLVKSSNTAEEPVVTNIVDVYLLQKDYAKAIILLNKYLGAHPQSYWSQYLLANTLFANQNYKDAAIKAAEAVSMTDTPREKIWPAAVNYLAKSHLKSSQVHDLLKSCLAYQTDQSQWTYIVGSYLLGETPVQRVLMNAKTREQKTEAATYIGLKLQLEGKLATEYFKKAISIGSTDCTEYYLAKSFL